MRDCYRRKRFLSKDYRGSGIVAAALLAAILCPVSCANDPSAYYPSGAATIVSSYESTDGGLKSCFVTLKLMNTGSSTIGAWSVSLSATTEIRSYYKTVGESEVILPGKSIYATVYIPYAADTEILAVSGLVILDEQYR